MNPIFAICVTLCVQVALAQPPPGQPASQTPAGTPPQAQPAKRGFRGPNIQPLAEVGFKSIFDGKSLEAWDGDTAFWRVENGAIVGETTADKQPKQNTFLIWRGGRPGDFVLKLQYKLTGHNSGIQIRSTEVPGLRWVLKGYQADMDAQQTYTGQFYEERGRGFLALRGQFNTILPDGKPANIASLGTGEELKSVIKSDDWNDVTIMARGHGLVQIINGRVTSVVMDNDEKGRSMEGLLGFQVHVGPAMRVEFRNVRIQME